LGGDSLGEDAASNEESNSVSGRVVGEADLKSILGELVSIGRSHNYVPSNGAVGDLAGDVLVGEADDETILVGVVLVLVLLFRLLGQSSAERRERREGESPCSDGLAERAH
jgi:hypothetical protein